MTGELILVFFLCRYLKKSLPAYPRLQKFEKIFLWSMYIIPALVILDIAIFPHSVTIWIGYLILFSIFYIIYLLPEFTFIRNVVVAILPFVLVSFIKDVLEQSSPSLFKHLELYINIIYPCAAVWMIAMLITYRKQQKVLKQEKEKREKEEEQNRIMAVKKTELEQMVNERTAELMHQKEELQLALTDLKNTQTQLIHSEKMASLGELTAGIAHEIQNPLNFMNNFSEVNVELIDEMKSELNAGNTKEAASIAESIKDNEQKITSHGKRADAIVKGMLQHSRKSTGQKEPTDINALADEYLRLSYHGLRAKDKSFNATMNTDFDPNINKISVTPQDIGRVLINLFNNAFYSVSEKKKNLNLSTQAENYEPTVSVTTKALTPTSGGHPDYLAGRGSGVIIRVKDNGVGIPQRVLDKIYQPFFTTKPTGQGTGLGLSLSYDIIKAHGGEINLETKEGEGAEFVIELPNV